VLAKLEDFLNVSKKALPRSTNLSLFANGLTEENEEGFRTRRPALPSIRVKRKD
jgi:hypothetical protein